MEGLILKEGGKDDGGGELLGELGGGGGCKGPRTGSSSGEIRVWWKELLL